MDAVDTHAVLRMKNSASGLVNIRWTISVDHREGESV
jgi:hypothetical protein